VLPAGNYLVRFNPVSGGGAGKYAAEFYNNKADNPVGADQVNVPATTTVENINAGLALLP
jgi:hypothetical protein